METPTETLLTPSWSQSGAANRVSYLQLHKCTQLTLSGVAELLERYKGLASFQLHQRMMCSIDDDDLLPPPFNMENATYGTNQSPLRELELNFQSSETHTVVPRWFIERGYARCVTKLTLGSKSPALFESAWALVQQCASTLEQLIISVPPRWTADAEQDITLPPIYASVLTSFRIEGVRDTSVRSVVRIVGCIDSHAPLLRGPNSRR
jgi:hypothetical protein